MRRKLCGIFLIIQKTIPQKSVMDYWGAFFIKLPAGTLAENDKCVQRLKKIII